MTSRSLRFILVIFIAGLIGYFIGVTKVNLDWKSYKPTVAVTSKEPPPGTTSLDMTMFWAVLDQIETKYYDKSVIDPQKIVNGAITGMVESLNDPFTLYLPPQQNTDFKQGLAGSFEGIGAELGLENKQIVIAAPPLDGSPALKAGLHAGDAIIKVDDQTTFGWTLDQAVTKVRGQKGTSVMLTIVRKSDQKTQDVKIMRDTITLKSVASWTKAVKDIVGIDKKNFPAAQDDKVAYIRLSQFGDNTNQEWVGIANKIALTHQQDPSLKGVVLDLRNNPGGYLTDAVFIASEFIGSGTIVMQEDGTGTQTSLPVSRKGLLTDIPLIVLINKGSASASEIVAGSLRDHNRAELIGETSFGKGTVQEAEDLGGGAGLHVTIAKWLTPNGTWVHKKGLTPDISVPLDPKNPTHDTQLEKAVSELVK